MPTYEDGVLVETYLDGPEISIDGAVVDGRYVPLFVARKQLSEHPYFQETGHVVDASDELQRSPELMEMLRRAHVALGLRRGMTHSEVRLTSNGPRIVEINARLGGDLIPYVGMLATGIDPARVAVDVVLGREPDVEMTAAQGRRDPLLLPDRGLDRPRRRPSARRSPACTSPRRRPAKAPSCACRRAATSPATRSSSASPTTAPRPAPRPTKPSAAVKLRYDRAPDFEGDRPDLSWIDAAIPAAAA